MAKPNFAIDSKGDFGKFLFDPDRKIPDAHLEEVCKPGKGQATCRYLCQGAKGMMCAKHTPMKVHLDKFAADKTMTATGDNCEGLPKPTVEESETE